MKHLRCLSLCLVAQFALAGGLLAEEPDQAYQAAVRAYVTAAGGELQAIREQADAAFKAVPEDKKDRFKDFYAKLEKCEQTYAALKSAEAKDFDKTKAQYEQQRLDVTKAWAKVPKQ